MKPQDVWNPAHYSVPSWLPNWEYEDQYPDAHTFSKQSFAWEFLRRNPYYQLEYKRISDLCADEGVRDIYQVEFGFHIPSAHEGSSSAPKSIIFHGELYRAVTLYGFYNCLFDPAYDLGEDICYPWIKRQGSFKSSSETTIYDRGGLLIGPEEVPVDGRIIPTGDEVLHLFDLSLPIVPQIENTKKQLIEAQKKRFGKVIRKSKTELEKFPLYLRLLDADACGIADSVIGNVLYPDRELFSDVDVSGEEYKNGHHRSPLADDLLSARNGAYPLLLKTYKLLL